MSMVILGGFFLFPLKSKLAAEDIITESAMLVAVLVLFFSFWKLYRANDHGIAWRIALAGVLILFMGSFLDLLDEFFNLPRFFPKVIENTFIVTGISVFSYGVIRISRNYINLASIDPMTGLFNRSYLNKALAVEIERARRYKATLSVMFIDLNDFKKINDRLGHIAGDLFLTDVAVKVKQAVRTVDILARYGGDEFVIIMPQTDPEGAEILLKRIQEEVSAIEFPGGGRVGISGGIAAFPGDGDDPDLLISLADKRMYENKRAYI